MLQKIVKILPGGWIPGTLFIFLLVFSSFAFQNQFIDWNGNYKLKWSDFEGKPDPASTNAALTSSSINVEFGFNDRKLVHSIKCRFNKEKSWGRIKNDYILNHEQGHFDIAEIHARLLHKELLEYSFNKETVSKDINNIYDGVMKLHVKVQKNYDLDTDHSLDTAQQKQWDRKIADMLKEYSKYASYK